MFVVQPFTFIVSGYKAQFAYADTRLVDNTFSVYWNTILNTFQKLYWNTILNTLFKKYWQYNTQYFFKTADSSNSSSPSSGNNMAAKKCGKIQIPFFNVIQTIENIENPFFGQSLKAFSTIFLIYAILASLARLDKSIEYCYVKYWQYNTNF